MNDIAQTPAADSDPVERFLAADARGRKTLLKEVLEGADLERLRRLAPAMRDPSPRVSMRLCAAIARAGADELFLETVRGVKPARAHQLVRHFERIAGRPPRKGEETEGDD
ncbi:MAG: hypothetical protein R3F20_14590 [Planctomycetota bacterium]